MDFATRRVVHSKGDPNLALPPGSTLKPLVIRALLASGKLRSGESLICPVELTVGSRSFGCSHPALAHPMTLREAIAYSCNNFVAHFAGRFEAGEFARSLWRDGLAPARVAVAGAGEASILQALGSGSVLVTPRDLLLAYRRLAAGAERAILEGLESAVEFGTARMASVPGVQVAGKTGTATGHAAWFAGFAPSRSPKFVAVVLAAGKSGGADAAPAAARLFAERI